MDQTVAVRPGRPRAVLAPDPEMEAWFAVDDATPVLLEVSEVKNRYYTA